MITIKAVPERLRFTLPPELEAHEPPEARGLTRDQVRLMVAWRRQRKLEHTTFCRIPEFLRAGDTLVVNTSATLPAALPAVRADGSPLLLHLSTRLSRDRSEIWIAELRLPSDGSSVRFSGGRAGERLGLPAGAGVIILEAYPDSAVTYGSRLWVVELRVAGGLSAYLEEHGRAIRYSHVRRDWPLSFYQNVYAEEPGSAEMPSAGRPFTREILAALEHRGVAVARVVLHTGVSSLEAGEMPFPEWFRVPAEAADAVNATRQRGGRVVAVGTTVVRALETAVAENGLVRPTEGWTELVVTPERGVRAVDGLLTGWHTPEASHLLMLEAIAGRPLVERSYHEALGAGYRWHEFGDVELLLP